MRVVVHVPISLVYLSSIIVQGHAATTIIQNGGLRDTLLTASNHNQQQQQQQQPQPQHRLSRRRRSFSLLHHTNIPTNSNNNPLLLSFINPNSKKSITNLKGGACSDSNPILFLKIAIRAILQTALMTLIITYSPKLTLPLPPFPTKLFGLPPFQWIGLALVVFASSLVGSIVDGGLNTASNQVLNPTVVPGEVDWYSNLQKPRWNPPGWLFPIMWLVVSKPTQFLSLSILLRRSIVPSLDDDGRTTTPFVLRELVVYCAHLALGDAWNKVFFGLECIGWGVVVISAFYGMLLTASIMIYNVDAKAGLFMIPTCGWVSVATALNWSIYGLNRKEKGCIGSKLTVD